MDSAFLAVVIWAILLFLWLKRTFSRRSPLPLPPAPPGYPIIGNLLDLANNDVHIRASHWSRNFDEDVISLKVLGKTMIILNSPTAVSDLFDKRASNYSDRPDMPMIVDLMGWDWTFALMRYGPRWKEHRRVFNNHFNIGTSGTSEDRYIQLRIRRELLSLMVHSPSKYLENLRHYTGHIILKRTYGHTVVDENDPYIRLVEAASQSTSEAAVPGAFLVDLFPSMKYIPEWFPGAQFKRKAREWRKLSEAMINAPYDMAKGKFDEGNAEPCFVSACLEQNKTAYGQALSEELIKDTAAVAYAAGADTSVSTLTTFILAMTLYPDVQKAAQAELDALLGGERLPDFGDKTQLPYVTAILKEVLRWIPVLPMGKYEPAVPHRAVNADTYKGYYIPAGSFVYGNAWAILHNADIFADPETFRPDRFIENPTLPNPIDNGVFGFGRRACAGRVMALDTMWIAMASILAAFDISKAVDERGNEITPPVKLSPGTISHPAPFPCIIKPRSKAALDLIMQDD
ncbi:cytochrome P450 [Desarmillaria ectypa]|nr:cytochrome P450 [Desarmillaria ectypa]